MHVSLTIVCTSSLRLTESMGPSLFLECIYIYVGLSEEEAEGCDRVSLLE